MDLSNFPSVSHRRVWHVGSMQARDKWCNGSSLEGAGLSVSLHPQEWTSIARLGGQPTWVLSHADKPAGRFLDYCALTQSQRELLAHAGRMRGWISPATRFKVSWFDSEVDDTRHCLFNCETTANEEAEELGQWAEDVKVDSIEVGVATEVLTGLVGHKIDDSLALDMTVTALVEESVGWDGVWWNEQLDVPNLSAPRGVLSRTALPLWVVQPA